MNSKKVKSVTTEEFNDIYYKTTFKKNQGWKTLFNKTIQQIENFSSSLAFWYVADFAKGVVKAGGDCDIASPISKKEWIGLHPWDIGFFFHPLDQAKMQSFIVFIASFLASKTDLKRKKIKISLVFRMLNGDQKYTWRIMEYPAMYYENNEPRFLLCHIKDIDHLIDKPKCVMYILDSNEHEPTLYFCDDEKVVLKPVNSQKALSQREIEIIKLLVKGLISKEIAKVLGISKNTVENHKQNIYTKTGTKKINELITFANRYIINAHEH